MLFSLFPQVIHRKVNNLITWLNNYQPKTNASKLLYCKCLQRRKVYTKKISSKTGKIPLYEEKLSTTYSEVS